MNLLITGAWQSAKEKLRELKQMGHSISFLQVEKNELPCDYEWVEGVICNGLFLYHSIEKFQNLRYVQLTSAGYDRVPLEYINEHGIEIHNARGVYSIPMAEYAISGVLQLYKKASFFYENQKQHRWEKHRGLVELFGKTVCIVGCGSVGSECAKRFQAFGCKTVGIATSTRKQMYFDAVYSEKQLDEVLKQSDVIVLTIPLTNRTRYMINEKRLAEMKPEVILVNIARGAVVDTVALEAALLSKKIHGGVLDAFEGEPLSENSALWNMENVIITPHNSFVGENNQKKLTEVIIENLKSGV